MPNNTQLERQLRELADERRRRRARSRQSRREKVREPPSPVPAS